MRILLVDDHDAYRARALAFLAAQPGLEVAGEADNGESAVRLAGEGGIDLVLMDVLMPGMNGIEATRRIAALLPVILVIGLSMHADERFAEAMLEAGARGYLLKEALFSELDGALRAVSQGERYVSAGVA